MLKKIVEMYFVLLFPASIGLFCVSKQAIIIFGRGNQYVLAIPVLMAFSIYLLTSGIDRLIENQIIYVFGYEKVDTKLALYGEILNLVLNYALVFMQVFTPATAVITTLISNMFLISIEYNYIVKKLIKLDIKLFSVKNTKYFIYSLSFLPVCLFINNSVKNILLSCFLDVIISSIIYLIILVVTKDKNFKQLYGIVLKRVHSK